MEIGAPSGAAKMALGLVPAAYPIVSGKVCSPILWRR
jgi:hypothetical protein